MFGDYKMTHHLGKHSLTNELNVTESLLVAGVDITSKLESLTSELLDLETKQGNISVSNLSNSTFQNNLYALGGIHLGTDNTLTFVPPPIRDWTQDQVDTDININNIPILNYAGNTIASNGNPGLTNFNFSEDRKNKLASISVGAQVNVQSDWNATSGDAFIQNKPNLSQTLDFDLPDTHYVQNQIGNVSINRTVAQLESDYPNINKLIEAMLKIEAAQVTIPAYSGASLIISTSNTDAKYGTTFPSNVTVVFNRGSWNSGSFKSDGATATDLLPHNPGSSITLNGSFGFTNANVLHGYNFTSSTPPEILFTSGAITGTFDNWNNTYYTLNASMTTSSNSTGDVYDNYGNVTTTTPVSQLFSTLKTWAVYKSTFVDNTEVTSTAKGTSGTAGFSNLNGTVKVFSSTSDIIVTNHTFAHKIVVPFTPAHVYEYDNVFSQVGAEWNSAAFTSVPVNVTNRSFLNVLETGANSTYHEITLTVSRTLNVDVKITK